MCSIDGCGKASVVFSVNGDGPYCWGHEDKYGVEWRFCEETAAGKKCGRWCRIGPRGWYCAEHGGEGYAPRKSEHTVSCGVDRCGSPRAFSSGFCERHSARDHRDWVLCRKPECGKYASRSSALRGCGAHGGRDYAPDEAQALMDAIESRAKAATEARLKASKCTLPVLPAGSRVRFLKVPDVPELTGREVTLTAAAELTNGKQIYASERDVYNVWFDFDGEKDERYFSAVTLELIALPDAPPAAGEAMFKPEYFETFAKAITEAAQSLLDMGAAFAEVEAEGAEDRQFTFDFVSDGDPRMAVMITNPKQADLDRLEKLGFSVAGIRSYDTTTGTGAGAGAGSSVTFTSGTGAASAKETPMAPTTTTKPSTLTAAINEATEAAYRVGASQLVKLARDSVSSLLARGLDDDSPEMRAKLSAFFRTEAGAALFAVALSGLLSLSPIPGAREIQARLARELRIKALADAGGMIADVLAEPMRAAIATVLQGMPADREPEVVGSIEATMASLHNIEIDTAVDAEVVEPVTVGVR
jgi:hypothetical protein